MGLVGPGTDFGRDPSFLLSFGNGLGGRETVLTEDVSSMFSLCIMLDVREADLGGDRALGTNIAPDEDFSSLPLLGVGLLDGVPGVSGDTVQPVSPFLRPDFGLAVP